MEIAAAMPKQSAKGISGNILLVTAAISLAGCVASVAPEPEEKPAPAKTFAEVVKAPINNITKFSSKDYGVKSSPRVTTEARPRKGGGRFQVGKPYQVKGRWYHPRLDPDLRETGLASWYGPNFHGRLTANGEIYDQFALTAAHPTLPLPSYARVTNLENGRKITVRVNDRGPFAPNRVIDLSARAAKMLGYDVKGLAKVKVEYAGEAPLHGEDEHLLIASFVGPQDADPGAPYGGASTGTMIAMAETVQPEAPVQAIENSFGLTDLTFVTANSIIPTERPTLFEGISMDNGQTLVYQAVPQPAAGLTANTLSFAGGEDSTSISAAVSLYKQIRIDHPWEDAANRKVRLSLGALSGEAALLTKALTDDLSGMRMINSDGAYTMVLDERDANTALSRLRQAGLGSARIL